MADTQIQNSADLTPQPKESEIQEKFERENIRTEEEEEQQQQQNQEQEQDQQEQQPEQNQEVEQNQQNNEQLDNSQEKEEVLEQSNQNQENKEQNEKQEQENIENIENIEKLEKSNNVVIEEEKPQESKLDEQTMTSKDRLQQTTMQKARELIEKSENLKNEAKIFIQQKYYAKALEIYTAALNTIHPDFFQNIPDQKIIQGFKTLYNQLLNNCAFVHFQQKNYRQSIEFCRSVKLSDPKNLKALYRASMCYKELEDFERAFEEIKKARQIQNTQEVNQLYIEIRDLYKEYMAKNKEKEKLLYSKMISQEKTPKSQNSSNNNNQNSSNNSNNNLQMSKSVFEKLPRNNEKTWVTLAASTVLGFCVPTAMGADFKNFGEIAGSICLSGSIFGGLRFQGKLYQSIFAAIAASIVGMFYKFTYQKAIKQN